jgi:hypothetical protein
MASGNDVLQVRRLPACIEMSLQGERMSGGSSTRLFSVGRRRRLSTKACRSPSRVRSLVGRANLRRLHLATTISRPKSSRPVSWSEASRTTYKPTSGRHRPSCVPKRRGTASGLQKSSPDLQTVSPHMCQQKTRTSILSAAQRASM